LARAGCAQNSGMPKQEHVPETRESKPNREQRRHPEKTDAADEELVRAQAEEQQIAKRGSDDEVSVRAKSTGHGKKTADKWNQ
jgi:hypothetical protein